MIALSHCTCIHFSEQKWWFVEGKHAKKILSDNSASRPTTDCLICLFLIQDGETPLHLAVRFNEVTVIDMLLKNKADADCRNKADADCRNKVWKLISRHYMSYP